MFTSRVAVVAALLGVASVGPTFAQTKTWNFGDATAPGSCSLNGSGYGNSASCTQQPGGEIVNLTVRAYGSTGGTSTNSTNPTSGTTRTYQTAALNYWGTGSGFGVYNQIETTSATSPNHSMDNGSNSGAVDMMLLNFTSAEILKQVTLGWSDTDGDFQVLAWTGAANASLATVQASIEGKTAAQMLTGGWSLVSTVDGAGSINTPDISYGVNANNVSSSYWLISAFNGAFGGAQPTSGVDSIKVLGVMSQVSSGGTPGVPIPGTLALAGLGLLAVARSRRRSAG